MITFMLHAYTSPAFSFLPSFPSPLSCFTRVCRWLCRVFFPFTSLGIRAYITNRPKGENSLVVIVYKAPFLLLPSTLFPFTHPSSFFFIHTIPQSLLGSSSRIYPSISSSSNSTCCLSKVWVIDLVSSSNLKSTLTLLLGKSTCNLNIGTASTFSRCIKLLLCFCRTTFPLTCSLRHCKTWTWRLDTTSFLKDFNQPWSLMWTWT